MTMLSAKLLKFTQNFTTQRQPDSAFVGPYIEHRIKVQSLTKIDF